MKIFILSITTSLISCVTTHELGTNFRENLNKGNYEGIREVINHRNDYVYEDKTITGYNLLDQLRMSKKCYESYTKLNDYFDEENELLSSQIEASSRVRRLISEHRGKPNYECNSFLDKKLKSNYEMRLNALRKELPLLQENEKAIRDQRAQAARASKQAQIDSLRNSLSSRRWTCELANLRTYDAHCFEHFTDNTLKYALHVSKRIDVQMKPSDWTNEKLCYLVGKVQEQRVGRRYLKTEFSNNSTCKAKGYKYYCKVSREYSRKSQFGCERIR